MKKKCKAALVSLPWDYFTAPSIALSSLKSFVQKREKRASIDIFYLNLEIIKNMNPDFYGKILYTLSNFPEIIYSRILYKNTKLSKNTKNIIENIFKSEEIFYSFVNKLKIWNLNIIKKIKWSEYDFVGFTTTYNQLLSSIFNIKEVKKENPKIKTILGGYYSTPEMAIPLMKKNKEIDIVVSGEGELNLYNIIKSKIEKNENFKNLPGISFREGDKLISNPGYNQIKDMEELEIPDYSDYFEQLNKTNIKKDIVKISVETSRGCPYNCYFCALNRCWNKGTYRTKKIKNVIKEIDYQNKKYKVNNFIFCDNTILENNLTEMSKLKEKLSKDIKFSYLSTNTKLKPSSIEKMWNKKMEFSFGVESLNNRTLKNMNKITKLMDHVQTIKLCELYGIFYQYCIIHDYPATKEEINENIKNAELLKNFSPPKINNLEIYYGSEIYKNPEKHSIKVDYDWDIYKEFFPEDMLKLFNFKYKKLNKEQKNIAEEFKIKMLEWRKEYFELKKKSRLPILYHFNYKEGLKIIRRTLDGEVEYILDEDESKLYNLCDTAKKIEEIFIFMKKDKSEIIKIIKELKSKKLVLESEGKIISLSLNLKEYMKRKGYREDKKKLNFISSLKKAGQETK